MKAAVKGLAASLDDPSNPSVLPIVEGIRALLPVLEAASAHEEIVALEQDVKTWLDSETRREKPRKALVEAYQGVLILVETSVAATGPDAEKLGVARATRRLLDAEPS